MFAETRLERRLRSHARGVEINITHDLGVFHGGAKHLNVIGYAVKIRMESDVPADALR